VRNLLIGLLLIIVIGGGGYLGWYYFQKNATKNLQQKSTEETKIPFMWGVNVNPSPVRRYNLEMWRQQTDYVADLGTSWIRVLFDWHANNKFAMYDEMIAEAEARNINVFLSLESSEPVETVKNPYKDGYTVASEISKHYKGRIDYYQILNEQGGIVVKGWEYSGEKESDFDPDKYNQVREWSKGAIAAIRENDPDAKIVISAHWTHVAYVQMLLKDKVDFDILGWDWYSDMKLMENKRLADGTLLLDKLESFGKPIILTEVNAVSTSDNKPDENEQANFIKDMANWAYKSGVIRGFFVHELVDTAPQADTSANYYGLITFKKASDGGYVLGDLKKAFYTYKKIIASFSE